MNSNTDGGGGGAGGGAATTEESSSSSSSSSPNYPRVDPRRKAEMEIVRSFTNTVLEHGRELLKNQKTMKRRALQGTKDGEGEAVVAVAAPPSRRIAASIALTGHERTVFNKQSYNGWSQGIVAGGLTFGILFGGMRLASLRRGITRTAAARAGTQQQVKLPPAPPQRYQHLDGGGRGGKQRAPSEKIASRTSSSPSTPSSSSLAISDDVVLSLQFLLSGAISVIVTSLVANLTMDQTLFYQHLSELPLQEGKSYFCHSLCPAIIQQMARTRKQEEEDDTGISTKQHQQQYSVTELLDNPKTEELGSILRLVRNCERRITFSESLKEERGSATSEEIIIQEGNQPRNDDDDDDGIVSIPPPGVPSDYY